MTKIPLEQMDRDLKTSAAALLTEAQDAAIGYTFRQLLIELRDANLEFDAAYARRENASQEQQAASRKIQSCENRIQEFRRKQEEQINLSIREVT